MRRLPASRSSPAPDRAAGPTWAASGTAVAALCAVTLAAFWPALGNGFVNWDDGANFLENRRFRGLDWAHLKWMWTTFHMGHYQPLSWMTLGLDYVLWGMDPRGYHLTSLVLHLVNAALFYFVAGSLLTRAFGKSSRLSALFAALLFAVHPLRVESVAWITERRDVLSGAFYLAAILFYLKACGAKGRSRAFGAALACHLLSLLSKGIGVTLPLSLLILDVYPLRRLPPSPASWREPQARAVLQEKVPFVAASLLFGIIAVLAQEHTGVLGRLAAVGALQRLELMFFGAAFYLWKSVVPLRLLPLYARPADMALWTREVCLSVGVVLALSAAAVRLRRHWPGVLAAWAIYLVTVFPVLGAVLSGIYTAADRYTYLACLSWAVLAGAGVELGLRNLGRPGRTALTAALCGSIAGLGVLTRRQTRVWRDSAALWRHTLSVDPDCAAARNNLGTALARAGAENEAVLEFRRALELDPGYAEAHNNLGTSLVHSGALEEGAREYRRALAADPAYAMARDNLGAVLAGQGKIDEAVAEYRKALAFDPGDAHAHNNLGLALAGLGRTAEAVAEYREALRLSPDYAQAAENLRSIAK